MPVNIPVYLDEGRHDRPSKAFINMIRELEALIGSSVSPELGLIVERRLDDPGSPITGQVWLIVSADEAVAIHSHANYSHVMIMPHAHENRVDDPDSPAIGQVWVRTDL